MARNGIGRRSKRWTSATGSAALRSTCSSFCPCTRPGGSTKPCLLHAEREAHQEIALVLLAAEAELLARRAIAERVLPVQRADQRLDLRGRHARGIQAADDRAHAGAGDRVDRHAHLVEYFQHADVRRAARAAAAQHQPTRGRSPSAACAAWASTSRRSALLKQSQCVHSGQRVRKSSRRLCGVTRFMSSSRSELSDLVTAERPAVTLTS